MIEFISQLPTEYQEVEYIESSGTQYIDTGYIVNASDTISWEFTAIIPSQSEAFMGANGYLQFHVTSSEVGVSALNALGLDSKRTFRIDFSNSVTQLYIDNTLVETKNWSGSYNGTNVKLGIFKLGDVDNGWHTTTSPVSCTLYEYAINIGENEVSRCVPCYRKADNVAGLYDLVNNVFYTNAGSGVFAVGANSNKHAITTITPGGVISFSAALRRRMMINASKGLPISELPLGTLIRIADSDGGEGTANYEIADINNLVPGGVVLVRKNIYSTSAFGSTTSYSGSTLDNFIGTTIFGGLPQKLRDKMMGVTIKYSNYRDITRKMFALTYTMVGFVKDNRFPEGKALQLYTSNASRIKNGYWWLSSYYSTGPSGKAWGVNTDGSGYHISPSSSMGVVPAFVIPSETPYNATPNTDGSYNLTIDTGAGSETITGTDVILNIITGETEDGNTNELGTIGFAKNPTTTFANRASSNEWQTVTIKANTAYPQNIFQFNGSFTIGVEITNTLDNSLIDKVIDFWNGNTDESVTDVESINDGTKITAQYTVERDATQQTVVDFEVVADPEIAATVTFTNSSIT